MFGVFSYTKTSNFLIPTSERIENIGSPKDLVNVVPACDFVATTGRMAKLLLLERLLVENGANNSEKCGRFHMCANWSEQIIPLTVFSSFIKISTRRLY